MHQEREPRPLPGSVYHPGGGFHSYPPAKNRQPRERVCPHCELPAATHQRHCPVCGTRYATTLLNRILRRA